MLQLQRVIYIIYIYIYIYIYIKEESFKYITYYHNKK